MKVAFLGTGLMGLPMAQRLLAADIQLVAYNRTPEKLAPLQAAGAEIVTHPRHAIRAAECVILMLTNAPAIYNVLLSDTAWQTLEGRTIIQMGTITPTESQEIRDAVVGGGGEYLEAPVLGTEPLLIGSVGAAAALKLALNQLIASLTTSFALSLAFVQRQGLDVDVFMQILRDSPLYAPIFDKKLQQMLDGNYADPNFPTKHLLKDTELFISEAKSRSLDLSSIKGVRQILQTAVKMSFADDDYSSLFSVIKEWGE
jgi:3-hydroxyisobutyrate dehydrogenase